MLQLDAMTIRGIGSYFGGSRLELRPLTILSGVNGSGKSTWFKTLAMLRRSANEGLLPFAFAVDDSNAYDVGFMNYSLYCSDDLTNMTDGSEQSRTFGPPACIGLELSVTDDFQIGDPIPGSLPLQNDEQRFLVEGKCAKGMKLRVRFAHPTGNTDTHIRPVIPGMFHLVELSVNGNSLQFVRPHLGDGDNSKPDDYLFGGSPIFGALDESVIRTLVSKRVVQIVESFFNGYFHISAVRDFHSAYQAQIDSPPEGSHAYRSVGSNGSRSHDVFYWNSRKEAKQTSVNDAGALVYHGLEKEVDNSLTELLDVGMGRHYGDEGVLAKYTNRFLGGAQPPKQFSSGFHQLFPIIVQLSVMNRGELLSIENPEVHLHPDLQLKVAEYLLSQIPKGRRIVLETHSDLIIRRVVRAILAEEEGLSQQQVSLTFSIAQSSAAGTGSVLQPFGVNEAGRIQWPVGFMDASIAESERLMDVMYGPRMKAHDEDKE